VHRGQRAKIIVVSIGAGHTAAVGAGLEEAGEGGRRWEISVGVGTGGGAIAAPVVILEQLAGVVVAGLPLEAAGHEAVGQVAGGVVIEGCGGAVAVGLGAQAVEAVVGEGGNCPVGQGVVGGRTVCLRDQVADQIILVAGELACVGGRISD